jgi:hypothetical protein
MAHFTSKTNLIIDLVPLFELSYLHCYLFLERSETCYILILKLLFKYSSHFFRVRIGIGSNSTHYKIPLIAAILCNFLLLLLQKMGQHRKWSELKMG